MGKPDVGSQQGRLPHEHRTPHSHPCKLVVKTVPTKQHNASRPERKEARRTSKAQQVRTPKANPSQRNRKTSQTTQTQLKRQKVLRPAQHQPRQAMRSTKNPRPHRNRNRNTNQNKQRKTRTHRNKQTPQLQPQQKIQQVLIPQIHNARQIRTLQLPIQPPKERDMFQSPV